MERLHSASSVNDFHSERPIFVESQTIKPLPRLPRGWSRVRHEVGLFLRSIGLGIVVTAFQGFFTKNFQEPEKIAIRRSRVTALLRTLIHVVPVGIAIFEIVLNWKGHYIGRNFNIQNYLQFAAKAHEVAIQSSIATILLSYIRHQISAGTGIPFGAVLGGLQFLQVNYLWSVELWSSILSKEFLPRKKLGFMILVFVCVTVAATAGPSSANLMIARQGLWPTGSTYLAVNTTVQELWPDRFDDDKIDRGCAIVRSESGKNSARCPLSDLYASLDAITQTSQAEAKSLDSPFKTLGVVQISHSGGLPLSRNLLTSHCYASSKNQSCASIPQTSLGVGFYLNSMFEINRTISHDEGLQGYYFMQKNYYQPYTIASCVADVAKDGSDQTPLLFARISETVSDFNKDRDIVSIPDLTKSQIINQISDNKSRFSVDWVDLPQEIFNTGIPGAVFVDYQGSNGSSYNIYTCTLNAGWGSSALTTNTVWSGTLYSRMLNIPSSWHNYVGAFDQYGYTTANTPFFANISNISYPQRRISASKNWMNLLNPTFEEAGNSSATFISRWLSSFFPQPEESDVAQIMATLLAVALSDTRVGKHWKVFPDIKTASRACDICLMFEMENYVFGWLYNVHETTTKLAIAVMFTFCVLVLAHILYSAISGVSSTAWDSAGELVALAMNSSPTKALQNTCAGIIGGKAFRHPVRVLATTQGHLELFFGEMKDSKAQVSELVVNEKYGKLVDDDGSENEELGFNKQGTVRKRQIAQSSE